MSVIQVLPDDLVNQIAAGEVVERPASVVKELVENALDAQATRVAVNITQGGIRSVTVTDDGVGLTAKDAELSFRRHATSKIQTATDLAQVATLGFRGEALPSIAAVASVRLRTRTEDAALGVEVHVENGGINTQYDIPCAVGTTVEVSELFAKVPARRKFLRTAVTESTHIVRWLERIALTRPDVRFSLERDGKAVLVFLPTADARERAIAVLPASVGGRLVPVRGQIPGAELFGFATPTDVTRGTTGDIHVLVNTRPVRDPVLLHAVRQAYHDALPPGRHPAAVLYLQIDPAEIDVNVHPAKSEVRFRDPGAVRALLRDSLVAAIGRRARTSSEYPAPTPSGWVAAEPRPPADLGLAWGARPRSAAGEGAPRWFAAAGSDPAERPPLAFAEHRYLGQLLGTYLVLEGPESMLLLDQHAAHERVLFERLRQTLLSKSLERQALLLPQWLELPPSSADALQGQLAALERAGFELEFGERGVRGGVRVGIRAVPALLSVRGDRDYAALLEETAAALREPEAFGTRDGIDAVARSIFATAACHAAVRKGDRLDPREVQGLLEDLDRTLWFPNCPHGRPILAELSEAELERRFGRR